MTFFWYFLQILAKSELNIIDLNVTAFELWYYNLAGFHVVAKKCKKKNGVGGGEEKNV